MSFLRKLTIRILLVVGCALSVAGIAFAHVEVYTDGFDLSSEGGAILCNIEDDLLPGQTIELYTDYTHGENDDARDMVKDIIVLVNGDNGYHYSTPDMVCHIEYPDWHRGMTDDTYVYVRVIVQTTLGNVYYDYRFTVDRKSVPPICEKHDMKPVTVAGSERYAILPSDPSKHFLQSCFVRYVCEICGEEGEEYYRTYSADDSPKIKEHFFTPDYENGRCCAAAGCSAGKLSKISSFCIQVPNNGRLKPHTPYVIYATWEPESQAIPDLEWETGAAGKHDNVIEKLGSGSNQCIIRTGEAGFSYLYVKSDFMGIEEYRAIEITQDEFDSVDVESYYDTLSQIPEGEPVLNRVRNPDIYNAIFAELSRIKGAEYATRLMRAAQSAPVLYQNLFAWSFFDYVIDGNPPDNASYFSYGRMEVNNTDPETWFHETGHAIDWCLKDEAITTSESYAIRLYNAIFYRIYEEVSQTVIREAEGLELSAGEILEVVDYIMGKDYDYNKLERFFVSPVLTGNYTEEQKKLFDSAAEFLNIIANIDMERERDFYHVGSDMYFDMLSGCTNQSFQKWSGFSNEINYYGGHGPLAHELYDPEIYTADYWYKDGQPTYAQNEEAWAEYFSSKMTGTSLTLNLEHFPEACEIMDEMARELLEGYKEKHRGND